VCTSRVDLVEPSLLLGHDGSLFLEMLHEFVQELDGVGGVEWRQPGNDVGIEDEAPQVENAMAICLVRLMFICAFRGPAAWLAPRNLLLSLLINFSSVIVYHSLVHGDNRGYLSCRFYFFKAQVLMIDVEDRLFRHPLGQHQASPWTGK
jgi:hypothetical protein